MDDKPLSKAERRRVEKIGFLRRLGIYEPDDAGYICPTCGRSQHPGETCKPGHADDDLT